MNTSYSISNALETQQENDKKPLNWRWTFYKSVNGHVIARCFSPDESPSLASNPSFIQISKTEYELLDKAMQS